MERGAPAGIYQHQAKRFDFQQRQIRRNREGGGRQKKRIPAKHRKYPGYLSVEIAIDFFQKFVYTYYVAEKAILY
jgi:hypothetical protein